MENGLLFVSPENSIIPDSLGGTVGKTLHGYWDQLLKRMVAFLGGFKMKASVASPDSPYEYQNSGDKFHLHYPQFSCSFFVLSGLQIATIPMKSTLGLTLRCFLWCDFMFHIKGLAQLLEVKLHILPIMFTTLVLSTFGPDFIHFLIPLILQCLMFLLLVHHQKNPLHNGCVNIMQSSIS